jgi:hypothetical protein
MGDGVPSPGRARIPSRVSVLRLAPQALVGERPAEDGEWPGSTPGTGTDLWDWKASAT